MSILNISIKYTEWKSQVYLYNCITVVCNTSVGTVRSQRCLVDNKDALRWEREKAVWDMKPIESRGTGSYELPAHACVRTFVKERVSDFSIICNSIVFSPFLISSQLCLICCAPHPPVVLHSRLLFWEHHLISGYLATEQLDFRWK